MEERFEIHELRHKETTKEIEILDRGTIQNEICY